MIFMDSYKVIIFDLDGTLFYKDQMISDNAAKKIIELEEKGIVIGLATGRFLNELDSFIEQLQLKKYQGFVICANGAEVIDLAGGDQHKFSLLSKQECYELIHLAKQYKLISYIHEDNDYHVFVPGALKKIYKRMEILFSRINIPFFQAASRLKLENKIVLHEDEYEKICFAGNHKSLVEFEEKVKLLNLDYAYYPSSMHSLEIVKQGISKFIASYWYLARKKISLKEVIFFGDGGNDDELISNVGLGIAMKNALDSTKRAAHRVSQYTNRQDGVYKQLSELFN